MFLDMMRILAGNVGGAVRHLYVRIVWDPFTQTASFLFFHLLCSFVVSAIIVFVLIVGCFAALSPLTLLHLLNNASMIDFIAHSSLCVHLSWWLLWILIQLEV